MRLVITLNMDNDAFAGRQKRHELQRVLDTIPGWASEPRRGEGDAAPLHDVNGNRVGTVSIEED